MKRYHYMFSLLVLAGFSLVTKIIRANPQSNPRGGTRGITAQVAGVTSEVVMDTYAEDSVVLPS